MTARRELARLRRWATCSLWPALMREPAWPPFPLPEDDREAPAFSTREEDRLRVFADWLWSASGGTRELGGDLADRMQKDLPDVPGPALARTLASVLAFVEDTEAEQVTAHDALLLIKDGLRGGAAIIAAPTLGLEPEGKRRR